MWFEITRFHTQNRLLAVRDRVHEYQPTTMALCVTDSNFFVTRGKNVFKVLRNHNGTVRLQLLGLLKSVQPNVMEDETREEGVEQLLEKLQDVNFVASVKEGFANQNSLCSLHDNKFNESSFDKRFSAIYMYLIITHSVAE